MLQAKQDSSSLRDWIKEHQGSTRSLIKYLDRERQQVIGQIVTNIENDRMDLVNKGKVQQLTELIDTLTEQ